MAHIVRTLRSVFFAWQPLFLQFLRHFNMIATSGISHPLSRMLWLIDNSNHIQLLHIMPEINPILTWGIYSISSVRLRMSRAINEV